MLVRKSISLRAFGHSVLAFTWKSIGLSGPGWRSSAHSHFVSDGSGIGSTLLSQTESRSNVCLACAFAKAKVRFVLPFAVEVPTVLLSMTEREASSAIVPGGWLRCIRYKGSTA